MVVIYTGNWREVVSCWPTYTKKKRQLNGRSLLVSKVHVPGIRDRLMPHYAKLYQWERNFFTNSEVPDIESNSELTGHQCEVASGVHATEPAPLTSPQALHRAGHAEAYFGCSLQ